MVESGNISPERIAESVGRLLKMQLGLPR
jgi:hypothetical protein